MDRFICIHGHFYQPPREHPWLEEVETEESARPYHDWNERICSECYEPNAAARILDGKDRIRRIVSTYERISFNFGPTLLAWMERQAPAVYQAVLEADRYSLKRFSGHGSAIAQVYNHMILPLANDRDRQTQVRWGVADFEKRFRRRPEGMWLAETAVDVASLEVLAEQGIRFTVLAPSQARRVRRAADGDGRWRRVSKDSLDTRCAYRVELPSGREIAVFFYDGGLSQAIAFEGLLANGGEFAKRLLSAFSSETPKGGGHLVHVATDGETYGHHHRYGEMALAYLLDTIDGDPSVELTNYGEFLDRHPPERIVEIVDRSSWSCAHGVERWRSDCGCKTGGPVEWNQRWRRGLRESLNWLRDQLSPRFDEAASRLLKDPWEARNDYVRVLLSRSSGEDGFFDRHALRDLAPDERQRALSLLELQRHAMLMFTSCGWFFDEVSRIETRQILKYAGRAIHLASTLFTEDLETPFLERLESAESNLSEKRNARLIYESDVRPLLVNLIDAGAHYVLCRLYDQQATDDPPAFRFEGLETRTRSAGRARLVVGRLHVSASSTSESAEFLYGALRFGGHNAHAGLRIPAENDAYVSLAEALGTPFDRGDFAAVVRVLDREFKESLYSLGSLFHDQRQRILDQILETAQQDVETAYYRIYEQHAPTMRFLKELGVSAPDGFTVAAQVSLNRKLRNALHVHDEQDEQIDEGAITGWLHSARDQAVPLDEAELSYAWRRDLERVAARCFEAPGDERSWSRLEHCLAIVDSAPFEVNLWKVQNGYYRMMSETRGDMKARAESGDPQAASWLIRSQRVAARLSLKLSEP